MSRPGLPPTLETGSPRPDPSLSLFLGLYLLILAFFILLVSLSTIEEMKARAVMESLSTTFGNEQPSGTEIGTAGGEGNQRLVEDFIASIAGMVRVAEVEVVSPGRLMRVILPAGVVFAADGETPRPSLHPLIDRVVATLSSPPPGLGITVEFALSPGTAEAERKLAARRADALAREMLARGAPPGGLSIALAPAAGTNAWLTFRVDNDAVPPASARTQIHG